MIAPDLPAFAAPWAFAALAALPLLWWLLRATPPAPRRIPFPALRFLAGLQSPQRTPARSPWWLLLLRLAAVTLAITGLAGPFLEAPEDDRLPDTRALVLVIDNGWASGASWKAMQDGAVALLDEAGRNRRPVLLVTTAATSAPPVLSWKDAGAVRAEVLAMTPRPWPTDRKAVLDLLKTRPRAENGVTEQAVWIHDTLASPDPVAARDLARALGTDSPLAVLTPDTGALFLLEEPVPTPPFLETAVRRPQGDPAPETRILVRLLDGQGRVMDRVDARLGPGETRVPVRFRPPQSGTGPQTPPPAEAAPAREDRQLRARSSLEVASADGAPLPGAGTRILMNAPETFPEVGLLLADGDSPAREPVPLLDPFYYVEKALDTRAGVLAAPLAALLRRAPSHIVIADLAPLDAARESALATWVENGGILIRFASARSGERTDSLLPVNLRDGDRSLGGALSWSDPARLAPFPPGSPFAGLPLPGDVTVTTQVLATPQPGLEERTWAYLEDGTPLVTAAKRGAGMIILFHVTPTPDWSTLPLSLLFETLLDRLLTLGTGTAGADPDATARPLPPWRVLDGLGRLVPPLPGDRPLTTGQTPAVQVGPDQPPGYYGNETTAVPLNLAPGVGPLLAMTDWPEGTRVRSLSGVEKTRDLSGLVLGLAFGLFLLDFLVSLKLRGLAGLRRREQ